MSKPAVIAAAAAGIALGIAAVAALHPSAIRQDGPAVPVVAEAGTAGVATRYACTFHWNGGADQVDVHMSPDGQSWQQICESLPVTHGSNTIWILIASETAAAATAPRIRIGTADRRLGFETAITL
jgi:hypothetical protein